MGSAANTSPNNGQVGCYDVIEFSLEVDPLPTDLGPFFWVVCDDEASGSNMDQMSVFELALIEGDITGGDPTLDVIWFFDLADEAADIPLMDQEFFTNSDLGSQTIIARVVTEFGCSVVSTVTLEIRINPVGTIPTPLEVCDDNNDGFTLFNLNDKDVEIIGGEPNIVVPLEYYVTESDAILGTAGGATPILTPMAYPNIVNNQIVYARMTRDVVAPEPACFDVVPLELIVIDSPLLPVSIPDFTMCAESSPQEFNLPDHEPFINPDGLTDVIITYYLSQTDAQDGIGAIGPMHINGMNPEPIWVRMESTLNGCFTVGTFNIEVLINPTIVTPAPYELCDDLGEPNDGITTFMLSSRDNEITGGDANLSVAYFEDMAFTIPLDPDMYDNIVPNTQTVYVQVTAGDTGCISTTTLTLVVNPNPDAGTPDPLSLCDINDTGDQMESFDLTNATTTNQITGGAGWDLEYYFSFNGAFTQDATDVVPPPLNDFVNTQVPSQTIYIRVTDPLTGTGCFEIVELVLNVDPLPDDTGVIMDIYECQLPFTGIETIDLLDPQYDLVSQILNGQDPANFTISFFLDQGDAQAGGGPSLIVDPNNHTTSMAVETIWVGITNISTGCYIGGNQSFTINIREDATATAPMPYTICDNEPPNDGLGIFDLDQTTNPDLYNEILNGQDPTRFIVTFHQTFEEADQGINALPGMYPNVINPQQIFIRVTNDGDDDPKCYAVTDMLLSVEQLPDIVLEDAYRLCVDASGNPIASEFGGASPPFIDTGLNPALYSFTWTLNGTLIPGAFGPSITALEGGVYEVTVTELSTGCTNVGSTTVTVSSPPLVFSAEVITNAFADSHSIEAMAQGQGDYVFSLDGGPFQASGLFEDVLPGNHIVTIQDVNGCGSVEIQVSVIDYPRFVTPNSDGYHDTWNIIGIAGADPTAKIYIFDRHGKLLKQVNPLGPGWDGTYNGNPLPSSDYWFLVEYTEDDTTKEFRGHFTLKR